MEIGFISLGCAKNRVDTEIMMALVRKSEHKLTNSIENADLVVINTCGFINAAKEEAIDQIINTGQRKEEGKLRYIIAAGCLAQRYGQELLDEMPEIDGLVGISTYHDLLTVIDQVIAGQRPACIRPAPNEFIERGERVLSTPAGSAYIKITEGCDNHCTYCAIPLIRGPLRSNPEAEIIKEAENLALKGIKELVILGQDTALYGRDLQMNNALPSLLKQLNQIEGIEWIRLMYLHPAHINQAIIEGVAENNKVIPYLDIPVQHAASAILKRMNRGHDLEHLYTLFDGLKTEVRDLVLRTTVMTGFPGETEQDFRQLADFVSSIRFDWLGCFAYSSEEGTAAALWPDQIPEEIKQERMNQIMKIQRKITRQKNISRLGQTLPILITGQKSRNLYTGRGYYQAPEVDGITIVKTPQKLSKGEFVPVRLKGVRLYDMIGELALEE